MQRTDTHDVVKIQSIIRGARVRAQYQINPLSHAELENYEAFVIGNDPQMPPELNNYCEAADKIALVATSGMRAVSLACKLGNTNQIPKIILVDNSMQVTAFWQAMRCFMQNDAKAGTEVLFKQNLPVFLRSHESLYRDFPADAFKADCTDKIKYLSQDISGYFQALINKYGYDFVRKVISHASVIKQSWADVETFGKIKNILNYLGINKVITYPSNIVSCISDQAIREQVLRNIESLSPMLSVHTDLCSRHDHPEKVLLITNQRPAAVQSTLFQSTCLNSAAGQQTSQGGELSLEQLVYLLMAAAMQAQNNQGSPGLKNN
ncbi:MAG: hypothetical protein KIT56_00245 [Gammaproteobacteria bacterium]|nr:hypothetical protein [Gammaproteobacteria bacterium]MCW5582315.1 hypothetical protein [Gammaproteobacteria bacterium]